VKQNHYVINIPLNISSGIGGKKNLLISKFIIQCKPMVCSSTPKKEKKWGQKLWDGLMANSQVGNESVIKVCTNQKKKAINVSWT